MSTILNTLKKLEEEKSVLEQPLDIKGMVTQGDMGSSSSVFRITSLIKWVAVSLLCVVIMAGSWYYFFKQKNTTSPEPVKVVSLPDPALLISSKSQAELKSISGISMAGIPLKKVSPKLQPVPGKNKTAPFEAVALTEDSKSTLSSIHEILPILESEPKISQIKKIREVLKSAQKNPVRETPSKKQELKTNGHIPGLHIKGIIFFNEGNPANYIFVSTPGNSSQKLKIGDQVRGAIIHSIQPDHVIFQSKRGLITVNMGG